GDGGAGRGAAEEAEREEGEEQRTGQGETVNRKRHREQGERERRRGARIGGKRGAQAFCLDGSHGPPLPSTPPPMQRASRQCSTNQEVRPSRRLSANVIAMARAISLCGRHGGCVTDGRLRDAAVA